jgi:hypothetical protein
MILAALALSAALSTDAVRDAPFPRPAPAANETLNLYRPATGCGDIQRRVSGHQQETFRKLGRLPMAGKEYAVLRQMDGCPVPAPMGYHPPAKPGAADAPAMREGAPSNRR